MTDEIRWGILGASRFARERLAPSIATSAGGRLAALASRSGEREAEPFRALAPDLKVFSDYQSLLADPDIDAVYIPLPNSMHFEWSLRALEAGKHVLCEKPVAMRAGEIDRLIEARDRTGLQIAEAFMIAHHPQWQVVREILRTGGIGDLRHVQATFCFNNADQPDNIRNRAELGGGALRDIGVYIIGGVRLATEQEPTSVDAWMRVSSGIDTFTEIRASFPGFSYTGTVSMRMAAWQEMTFLGTRGSLRMNAPFNAELYGDVVISVRRAGAVKEIREFAGARQYELQIEAFHRSIRDSTPYPCPLEFSRGTQRVIDRVQEYAWMLQ